MIIARNIDSKKVCKILSGILSRLHTEGPVSPDDFETMAYIKKFYALEFKQYEKQILFCIGLFFKTEEPDGILSLAYSLICNAIQLETNHFYTPVQAKEYKEIKDHKYYSFSAPTSTGKSYLFQDLIKGCNMDVVIVLPSRALIAEYLFKIKEIVPKDVLVLQFVDNINTKHTKRRVFIITPERSDDLFAYKDALNIGLLLFDEAQISEEEIRGIRFDALVRKTISTFPNAKKIFAHPFVSNPEAQLQRNLIKDDFAYNVFRQNSVGKIFLTRNDKGEFETFSPYNINLKGFLFNDVVEEALNNSGSVLFYVSKASLYSEEFENKYQKYIRQCDDIENPEGLKIIETLHQYIGDSNNGEKRSRLISLMKKGIVIHHGSMPLRIRILIEEFVRIRCAKLCFATSTLIQGINMPFDVVVIDCFKFNGSESQKILELKNLIGRAGRTTSTKNKFDFGYVVIPSNNKKVFTNRISKDAELSPVSKLNSDFGNIDVDNLDLVEAIRDNAFDYDLRITKLQKSRIEQSDIFNTVHFILDTLIKNNDQIISAEEYYLLGNHVRVKLKQAFARLYTIHLRRQELTKVEKVILSTSIPIILWRVQGKSFREIVSLRHNYITQKKERNKLKVLKRTNQINDAEYNSRLCKLGLKYSQIASALPNTRIRRANLFSNMKYNFDILVYDTYDYLDKVIAQSLSEPISAVLKIYQTSTNDLRATILANYIKYGTNNKTCIWLMRYGFSLDDMEWLLPCISHVDEHEIVFNEKVDNLDVINKKLIDRYIH